MDLYIPLAIRTTPLSLHGRRSAAPLRRAKARKALCQARQKQRRLGAHALAMPAPHERHAVAHALARRGHDPAGRAPQPHVEALLRQERARVLGPVQIAAPAARAPLRPPPQHRLPQVRQREHRRQHGVQRARQRVRVAQVQRLQRWVRGEEARQVGGVEGQVAEGEARQAREPQRGRQARAAGGPLRPAREQVELLEVREAVECGGERGLGGWGGGAGGPQNYRCALDVPAERCVLRYER